VRHIVTAFLFVTLSAASALGQAGLPPAEPVDPFDAIADALGAYPIVGIGEGAHRGEQDNDFRLALIRHARVAERAQDVVTECGNSRYQDVMDRYIRGEEVSASLLRRTWEDSIVATTICDSTVYRDFFAAVRQFNAGKPPEQQWRVLLGGPPIDWESVKTFDDITKFEAGRDRFAAELIRREVLSKGRRALIMYGRIHMLLRNERDNYESANWLAAQLEAEGTPVFKIWTAVGGFDLAAIQEDVRSWRIPSLVRLRGTRMGAADFMSYFPSDGRLAIRDGQVMKIPRDQWRPMPMERLVDAVLYLGPTVTYARIPPELCNDSAYLDMRLRRLSLIPGGQSEMERLKQNCAARR
jgi:hypothetical protein